jgi:cyclopropane fatty-acyl-phospholipid synthase-like methyltransferase
MREKRDFKFDKKAAKYDDSYEGKLSEKFYTLVTENVELTDGMTVLDMGCGTGTILHRLSQKCRISGYGIDVEKKCLNRPERNVRIWKY